MEWTKISRGWRSGSYLIELLEPGQWGLFFTSPADDEMVRTDPVDTSGSLRRLKARAEALQDERAESATRKKQLATLLVSMIVFVVASPQSGETAAIVTIVAFGTMLWAALKLAHRPGSRPWDRLRQMYQ
jgi:hypothetical protein